jgi:hypothetical protein
MDKEETIRLRHLVNDLFFKKDCQNVLSAKNIVSRVLLCQSGQSLSIKI